MIADYFLLLIGAILVNNFVLVQFLGLCPFMGVSNKLETAIGMSSATTFVLTLASIVSWLTYNWLLLPLGLEYLKTISFILVIAVVVQFTEMVVRKTSPMLYKVLGVFLPLITTNCAVLGVALLNINKQHSFLESALYGFGAAVGFSLVLILFAAMRERLTVADVPAPFKGAAIGMITAGLMSLAFMGFAGTGIDTVTTYRPISAVACPARPSGCGLPFGACLALPPSSSKPKAIPSQIRSTIFCPKPSVASAAIPAADPTPRPSPMAKTSTSVPPGGEAGIQALADLLDVEPCPLDDEHGEEKRTPRSPTFAKMNVSVAPSVFRPARWMPSRRAKQCTQSLLSECTGCDLCV